MELVGAARLAPLRGKGLVGPKVSEKETRRDGGAGDLTGEAAGRTAEPGALLAHAGFGQRVDRGGALTAGVGAGSFSTAILWPGRSPRWVCMSLRKATCPLAATVTVLTAGSPAATPPDAMQNCLTSTPLTPAAAPLPAPAPAASAPGTARCNSPRRKRSPLAGLPPRSGRRHPRPPAPDPGSSPRS